MYLANTRNCTHEHAHAQIGYFPLTSTLYCQTETEHMPIDTFIVNSVLLIHSDKSNSLKVTDSILYRACLSVPLVPSDNSLIHLCYGKQNCVALHVASKDVKSCVLDKKKSLISDIIAVVRMKTTV